MTTARKQFEYVKSRIRAYRILILVFAIALVAVGAFFLYRFFKNSKDSLDQKDQEETSFPTTDPETPFPGTPPPPDDKPPGSSESKSDGKTDVVVIVVSVIGGLALVGLIIVVILLARERRKSKRLADVILASGLVSQGDLLQKGQKELLKVAKKFVLLKQKTAEQLDLKTKDEEEIKRAAQEYQRNLAISRQRVQELETQLKGSSDKSTENQLKAEIANLKTEILAEKAKEKTVEKFLTESDVITRYQDMKPEYDKMKKTYDYLLDMQRIRGLPPENVTQFAVQDFDAKISQLYLEGRRLDEIANKLDAERIALEKSGASKSEVRKAKLKWGKARKKADLVILDEDIYTKAKQNSRAYIEKLIADRKQFFEEHNNKFLQAKEDFDKDAAGKRPFLLDKFGLAFGEVMTVQDDENKDSKLAGRKDMTFISVGSLGLRERYALYYQIKDIEFKEESAQAWKSNLFTQIEKDIKRYKNSPEGYYLLDRNKSKFFRPKTKVEAVKPPVRRPGGGGLFAELRKKAGKVEAEVESEEKVVEKQAKASTTSLLEAIRSRGKSEKKETTSLLEAIRNRGKSEKKEIKKTEAVIGDAYKRFAQFQERKKREIGAATETSLIEELQKRQQEKGLTESSRGEVVL